MNSADLNNCGLLRRPEASNKKPGCIFTQSGKVARSGEEKASHVPAPMRTVEVAEKFHGKSIVADKFVRHGSYAIAALHNFNKSPIL
ncbi:hypothetical protein [Mesorhizobium sp. NFR06]|uniref:hypothetical protein n=1 Tax=Mesorhizobium sp. NFR06 TaxID=1566290 RepID=UPI00122D7A7D|nr:hypothetical protein [Mesorhizobium sp. NFR06]